MAIALGGSSGRELTKNMAGRGHPAIRPNRGADITIPGGRLAPLFNLL